MNYRLIKNWLKSIIIIIIIIVIITRRNNSKRDIMSIKIQPLDFLAIANIKVFILLEVRRCGILKWRLFLKL